MLSPCIINTIILIYIHDLPQTVPWQEKYMKRWKLPDAKQSGQKICQVLLATLMQKSALKQNERVLIN